MRVVLDGQQRVAGRSLHHVVRDVDVGHHPRHGGVRQLLARVVAGRGEVRRAARALRDVDVPVVRDERVVPDVHVSGVVDPDALRAVAGHHVVDDRDGRRELEGDARSRVVHHVVPRDVRVVDRLVEPEAVAGVAEDRAVLHVHVAAAGDLEPAGDGCPVESLGVVVGDEQPRGAQPVGVVRVHPEHAVARHGERGRLRAGRRDGDARGGVVRDHEVLDRDVPGLHDDRAEVGHRGRVAADPDAAHRAAVAADAERLHEVARAHGLAARVGSEVEAVRRGVDEERAGGELVA